MTGRVSSHLKIFAGFQKKITFNCNDHTVLVVLLRNPKGGQMERKSMKVAVAIIVVSALANGFAGAGSASASTTTAAQANAAYAASIADAKAIFLATVRPSRATMVDKGKRAEAVRRLTVKQALIAFNSVVATEKAPSLAAEKVYKASVAKSVATPTDATLKAAVKANLAALTKATAALSVDVKITAAHAEFAKVRTAAMGKFKAALEISANQRARTLERASVRYKADKARAFVKLQAALKKATK